MNTLLSEEKSPTLSISEKSESPFSELVDEEKSSEVKSPIIESLVGEGTYGVVYRTNRDTVIKTIAEGMSVIEIDILFRLRSPNILRGIEIHPKGIEMEYITGGSFEDIYRSKVVGVSVKKKLLLDYVKGVKCLHDANYLHLDLKPQNLLFNGDPTITLEQLEANPELIVGKIIDFGLSSVVYHRKDVVMPLRTHQLRISWYWRPPECFRDPSLYSDKSDVWSLGVIIHDTMTRNYLFKSEDEEMFAKEISEFSIPELKDPELESLLTDMLSTSDRGKYRFDINQVLEHEYFASMNDELYREGDRCEFVPTQININYPFSNKASRVVSLMLRFIFDRCLNYRLEFMFNAIELLIRYAVTVDISDLDSDGLAMSCLSIAARLHYAEVDLTENFFESIYNDRIIDILRITKQIRVSRAFEQARYAEDLLYAYNTYLHKQPLIRYEEFLTYNTDLRVRPLFGKKGTSITSHVGTLLEIDYIIDEDEDEDEY
jgi:serine/threonine protein kinase